MPIAVRVPLLPLIILSVLVSAPPARADRGFGTDSLILQEIADSLHVNIWANPAWEEGGRVTRYSIYYGGQRGAVPPALGKLDSLRRFHMAITGVTSLPREIGLLQRLDTIDIGTSALAGLPDEVGDLPNLRALHVVSCKLRTLPVSLMKLGKLEYANFAYNSICHLDDSLRQWILARWPKALDHQNLSQCPSTGIAERTRKSAPADPRRHAPQAYPAPAGAGREGVLDRGIRYYSPLGRRVRVQDGG